METGSVDPKRGLALKLSAVLFAILFAIVLVQSFALARLWRKRADRSGEPRLVTAEGPENLVKARYPFVDFSKIYPGLSAEEIDQVQRECFRVRYVFAPFVQFKPVPVTNRFVQISPAGFRWGAEAQPWPPRKEDFVVFVFGGSTTFSYGLPNDATVVAQLQRELRQLWPDKRVQCYNFGRGFFFSTQERLLFELLLENGNIPDLAIFVDGVNDYFYATGKPRLTDELSRYVDGELAASPPPQPPDAKTKALAAAGVINRMRNHTRLTGALGKAHNVATVFIGQPAPFHYYPKTPETYPFGVTAPGHYMCAEFYPEFLKAAERGEFGSAFIWCGDVFSDASASMYADGVHYSPLGANTLARAMAKRIDDKLRVQAAAVEQAGK